MSRQSRDSLPQILTVEPGPWRRRKRLVLPVVLANIGDVLLMAAFVGMMAYSCWSFQNPSQGPVSHARLRKGAQLPAPTLENTR
jgi:hypothetical protein